MISQTGPMPVLGQTYYVVARTGVQQHTWKDSLADHTYFEFCGVHKSEQVALAEWCEFFGARP